MRIKPVGIDRFDSFFVYSTIHKKVVAYLYNINEIRFFYEKSLILSKNRDFGGKSRTCITICITIYSKNSAKK